jgi:hypothetical protein
MSNTDKHGAGYYGATLKMNMDAFDKLPAIVRAALAMSDTNWSAAQLRKELRRAKADRKPQVQDAKTAAAFIRQQDAAKHRSDADLGIVCGGQR